VQGVSGMEGSCVEGGFVCCAVSMLVGGGRFDWHWTSRWYMKNVVHLLPAVAAQSAGTVAAWLLLLLLLQGLWPNYLKVVPSIAIAFVTYEQVKELLGWR